MYIFNRRLAPNFNPNLYSLASIVICVAISQLLHIVVKTLSLPVWLDTTGVIIATVMGGLIPGIITALINSILTAILYYDAVSFLYVIPALVIPLILNYCLKKAYIKNFLSLIGMFFVILTVYSFISAIISILVFNGYTNYTPVDKIFNSLITSPGIDKFFASFTSRIYISFFDFVISSILSCLFVFILENYTPFNFK